MNTNSDLPKTKKLLFHTNALCNLSYGNKYKRCRDNNNQNHTNYKTRNHLLLTISQIPHKKKYIILIG